MTNSSEAAPSAALASALAYIPQWLGFQMRVNEQPGCSFAIAQKDTIVLEGAFGVVDIGTKEPITPRHRFRVASHSKSFASAGIMKLREQRKVRLDDAIGDYVEGLHPDIAAATISQLLSHTVGIFRDGRDTDYWQGRAPFPDAARIRRDLTLPPTIDANTRLKYSNHGFGLIGLVVGAITGMPYTEWIQKEIILAAGLTETTADAPANGELAYGHSTKSLLGRRLIFSGEQPTNALAPAAGVVSTAADLVKFFSQLAPNAEKSILSPASRREMTRQQWRDTFTTGDAGYGLGILRDTLDGWESFGHSGGFPGYITRTVVVPERELTLSVLTNASDGPAHMLLDGMLYILKRFLDDGAPTPNAAEWAGRWWSMGGATDLVPIGDKVLLAAPGQGNPFSKAAEVTVTAQDEGRIAQASAFHSYGEPLRRVRNGSGDFEELWIAGAQYLPEKMAIADALSREKNL